MAYYMEVRKFWMHIYEHMKVKIFVNMRWTMMMRDAWMDKHENKMKCDDMEKLGDEEKIEDFDGS